MDEEVRVSQMPRLFNIFDMPKITSVRATTMLRSRINIREVLKLVPHTREVRTADKNTVKFELRRGAYLLLFPSGYVEVHAPNEGGIREVLVAFRDELFKHGLLK